VRIVEKREKKTPSGPSRQQLYSPFSQRLERPLSARNTPFEQLDPAGFPARKGGLLPGLRRGWREERNNGENRECHKTGENKTGMHVKQA